MTTATLPLPRPLPRARLALALAVTVISGLLWLPGRVGRPAVDGLDRPAAVGVAPAGYDTYAAPAQATAPPAWPAPQPQPAPPAADGH